MKIQAASFTVSDIEKMRKETLTLLRAAEKESSYDEALQVRDAIRKYQDHLEVLFYKKMAPSITDKSIEKEFRSKTWAFHIEMALPLWPDKNIDKDTQYRRWQEKKSKWLSSVKRKARVAWSAVTDLFLRGNDQKEIEDTFSDINEMEGFRIVFKDKPTHDNIPVIQASLKIARERLEKVFPKALSRKPTLIFERQGLDKGGQYELFERGVVLNLDQWHKYTKNPQKCAQIVVHELAHDIEHNYLSDADLTYWRAAVMGDYGWIKLSEIIEKWPDDMATQSLYWLGEHLVSKDPILALKIQTLVLYRGVDYRNKEQAKEDLKKEDKMFSTPNSPISPYADKNPAEAFCEAFSFYTVYGPRAVLPVVRMWLRTILPSANIVASFKEQVQAKYKVQAQDDVWFHGRTVDSEVFDLKYVGRDEAKDQEGIGFYFTKDKDDASGYAAPNGVVLTVELKPRKLVSLDKPAKGSDVDFLIDHAPDLEGTLSNWDENPVRAKREAKKAMMAPTAKETFESIWFDFYKTEPKLFLEKMISLGYDGHRAARTEKHIIMYNPKAIKVIKKEHYKEGE